MLFPVPASIQQHWCPYTTKNARLTHLWNRSPSSFAERNGLKRFTFFLYKLERLSNITCMRSSLQYLRNWQFKIRYQICMKIKFRQMTNSGWYDGTRTGTLSMLCNGRYQFWYGINIFSNCLQMWNMFWNHSNTMQKLKIGWQEPTLLTKKFSLEVMVPLWGETYKFSNIGADGSGWRTPF
jgi:hypothetical protein